MEIIKLNNENNYLTSNQIDIKFIGRVVDIILDNNHPEFERLGGWDSIGTIFFNEGNKIVQLDKEVNLKSLPYAKPIFSWKKYYPLKNELVQIFALPNFQSQINLSVVNYYYSDTLNIWNHPHHNALPNNLSPENPNSEYNKTGIGTTKLTNETSTEIDLGKNFKENPNVKPLLPKEGDLIFESRFGSSVRFSNGAMIIRNGQNPFIKNKEGWTPIEEDINNDLGSIYFSNSGSISIEVASTNLKSFDVFFTNPSTSKIITPDKVKTETSILSPSPTAPPSSNPNEEINQYFTSSILPFTGSVEDDFNIPEELFDEGEENIYGTEVEYNGGIAQRSLNTTNPNNVSYFQGKASYNIGNISGMGKITSDRVPLYARPLLDMIAYAEGTPYGGKNNGYDVFFDYKILNGWNENYTKGHGKIRTDFIIDGKKYSSDAGGRYGFLSSTWIWIMKGDVAFNKENQDYGAYKLLQWKGVTINDLELIYANSNKFVYENQEFLKFLDKTYTIWASLSNSKNQFKYKGQGTSKIDKLYFIYKQALKAYGL